MATGALAQLTDDASNYGGANPAWETGANEGAGFGPWTLNNGGGGTFLASSTEGGPRINDIDTGDQAFGMWNGDAGNATEAIRGFDTDVWGVGSVLTFDFSFRFDDGSRGVTLADSSSTEIFYFVINSSGYAFPGGGASQTAWPGQRENGEVLSFSFRQDGADVHWVVIGMHSSSPLVEGTLSNVTPNTFRVFSTAGSGGGGNDVFFNNLEVTEGSLPPLRFVAGVANPTETGDIEFTLARHDDGDSPDQVDLSSSNEDAVTVPASITFGALEDQVSFTGTVVSVTSGSATILASNTVTGATAQFVVNPQPPTLFISGPFDVFEFGTETYTLTRLGAVGDDIVFSSTDTGVLTVPAMESFGVGEDELMFDVEIVGYGFATIFASNVASGAVTDYGVNVLPPSLTLSGPTTISEGAAERTYTLTRVGPVADLVNLLSSNTGVLTVGDDVSFPVDEDTVTFQASVVAPGVTDLSAGNVDATATPLTVTVTAIPAGVYDEGSFYEGTWDDNDNEGTGFGPWSFNHISDPGAEIPYFAGVFIGDPAIAGISGMDSESFGFFANPNGSPANAEVSRALLNALSVGDVFQFQLGLNFDSNNEASHRGFNLLAGGTQLLNINMGNSSTITINGEDMFLNYGSAAILVNIQYLGDGNLRVWATGRDGVETYDEVLAVPTVTPDNFAFYFNATDAATDERQMYVNNFRVFAGVIEPDGPAITTFMFVGGDPQVTIEGEAGFDYQLVYTVDLIDINWELVDSSGVLNEDGLVTLTDETELTDDTRFYGVLIVESVP